MDIVFLNSTTRKLHRYGLGLLKKEDKATGSNVAGKGSNAHVVMSQNEVGQFHLTGAQVQDGAVAKEMAYVFFLPNASISLSRINARMTLLFKTSSNTSGSFLTSLLIKTKRIPPFYHKTIYPWRYRIKILFARLKENRRFALRADKLALTFLASQLLLSLHYRVVNTTQNLVDSKSQ